jgi:hypothetical protein
MSKEQWIKENLKAGELYAGLILGKDGQSDHHLVLLPGEAESVTWAKAKEFAKKAGGELPTRREQSLLFANLKQHFQPRWYWSSEEHASDSTFAWVQYFSYGFQISNLKSSENRARAIRRIFI